MDYYKKCLEIIGKLRENGKKVAPHIRWSNKLILEMLKTPLSYLNPSKARLLKPINYQLLYGKLTRISVQKIIKQL